MDPCTYAIRPGEPCREPGHPREPDERVLCDEHHAAVEKRRREINHERRMNRRASTARL